MHYGNGYPPVILSYAYTFRSFMTSNHAKSVLKKRIKNLTSHKANVTFFSYPKKDQLFYKVVLVFWIFYKKEEWNQVWVIRYNRTVQLSYASFTFNHLNRTFQGDVTSKACTTWNFLTDNISMMKRKLWNTKTIKLSFHDSEFKFFTVVLTYIIFLFSVRTLNF